MGNQGLSVFFLKACFLSTWSTSFLAMDKPNPYFTPDMVYENIKKLREQFFDKFDKRISKTNNTHDQRLVSWFETKIVNHKIVKIPMTEVFLVAEQATPQSPWYLTLYAYEEKEFQPSFPPVILCKKLLGLEPSDMVSANAHPLIITLAQASKRKSERYIVSNMSSEYIEGALGLADQKPELIHWKIDNRIKVPVGVTMPNW